MKPRILLTVGGTGGHVFPAVALAEELSSKYDCDILFAGGKLGQNPYFEKKVFDYREVDCGKLSIVPWKFLLSSYSMVKGVFESLRIISRYNPDAVIGFGSYYTLPVIVASKLLGRPIFLHEANSIPGRLNRWLAPFAEKTWVHFPAAAALLKGNVAFGGMPLRPNFRKGLVTKEAARRHFQLDPSLMTILVFGGSQGAQKINALFSEAALFHFKDYLAPFQVLHFTGNHADAAKLMERYVSGGIPAYVRPFEKRMDMAWAAADIAVTRAGAASIAEQIEYEVPGVLIPYPYATDAHQDKNADFLVETKLAMKVVEEGLTPQSLTGKIHDLCSQAPVRCAQFREYKLANLSEPLSQQIFNWLKTHNSKNI